MATVTQRLLVVGFVGATALTHAAPSAAIDAGVVTSASCDPFDGDDATQWPRYPAAGASRVDDYLRSGISGAAGNAAGLGPVGTAFIARAKDGRMLVVLRSPWASAPFDAVRVFFGSPSNLEERTRTAFQTARDGGTTVVTFRIGEKDAVAYFPVYCGADGRPVSREDFAQGKRVQLLGDGCIGRLTIGGDEQDLVHVPREKARLKNVRFVCRR